MIEIRDSEHFDSKVYKSDRLLVVFFYFPAYPGSRTVSTVFNELADEYENEILFAIININKNRGLAKKFNVRAIPRFMFFEEGESISGLLKISDTDELPDLIRKYVK